MIVFEAILNDHYQRSRARGWFLGLEPRLRNVDSRGSKHVLQVRIKFPGLGNRKKVAMRAGESRTRLTCGMKNGSLGVGRVVSF